MMTKKHYIELAKIFGKIPHEGLRYEAVDSFVDFAKKEFPNFDVDTFWLAVDKASKV